MSNIFKRCFKDIKKEPIEYFVALFCVLGNGAWVSVENTRLYTFSLIIVLAIYLLIKDRKVSFDYWLFPLVFLIVWPIIATLLKLSPTSNLLNLFATTLLFGIISLYSRRKIARILDKYAQIIVVLAVLTIVMKILLLFVPFLYNLAQKKNTEFGYYYNFFFYTKPATLSFRSQSIFWEPGVWSVNQMFALAWYTIFRKDLKFYPIFLLSMLFTMSTTGLALFAVISVYIFFFSDLKIPKKKIIIVLGLISLILAITLPYLVQKYDIDLGNVIYMQTVGKVTTKNASYNDRLDATLTTWHITKENPLFGIGRSTRVYVTSASLEILYQTGIPFFLIYFLAFSRVFKGMTWFLAIPYVLIFMNGEPLGFLNLYTFIVIFGCKIFFSKDQEVLGLLEDTHTKFLLKRSRFNA